MLGKYLRGLLRAYVMAPVYFMRIIGSMLVIVGGALLGVAAGGGLLFLTHEALGLAWSIVAAVVTGIVIAVVYYYTYVYVDDRTEVFWWMDFDR